MDDLYRFVPFRNHTGLCSQSLRQTLTLSVTKKQKEIQIDRRKQRAKSDHEWGKNKLWVNVCLSHTEFYSMLEIQKLQKCWSFFILTCTFWSAMKCKACSWRSPFAYSDSHEIFIKGQALRHLQTQNDHSAVKRKGWSGSHFYASTWKGLQQGELGVNLVRWWENSVTWKLRSMKDLHYTQVIMDTLRNPAQSTASTTRVFMCLFCLHQHMCFVLISHTCFEFTSWFYLFI